MVLKQDFADLKPIENSLECCQNQTFSTPDKFF